MKEIIVNKLSIKQICLIFIIICVLLIILRFAIYEIKKEVRIKNAKNLEYYIEDFKTNEEKYNNLYEFLKKNKIMSIESSGVIICSEDNYLKKYKNLYICSEQEVDVYKNRDILDFYIKMDAKDLFRHASYDDSDEKYRIRLICYTGHYPQTFFDIYPDNYDYKTGEFVIDNYGYEKIYSTKLNNNWYYNEAIYSR